MQYNNGCTREKKDVILGESRGMLCCFIIVCNFGKWEIEEAEKN